MFQTKTLYVEMYVNIETEKYEDMDELMKNIKDDFCIEPVSYTHLTLPTILRV